MAWSSPPPPSSGHGLVIPPSQIGSAASTMMGFIFPGLVILMLDTSTGWGLVAQRAKAGVVVLIGAVLFVNGFVSLSL